MEKQKNPKNVKRGKKSKAQGMAFELRTRKDLEEKGWTVSKWGNQVEFETRLGIGDAILYETTGGKKFVNGEVILGGKLIQAKPKMVFNPMIKRMVPQQTNSGFPDFVCMRTDSIYHGLHKVIGVESKMTGVLNKIEKEKCKWLLDNGIFSKILVARKTKVKNRVVVEYEDFVEIEKRMEHSKKQNKAKIQSKSQSEKSGHRKH